MIHYIVYSVVEDYGGAWVSWWLSRCFGLIQTRKRWIVPTFKIVETTWCFKFSKQNGAQSSLLSQGTVILKAGHKSFIVNCASISPPISMEVVFQLSPEIPFRFNPKPLTFSNRSRIDFCRPLSATSDSRSRNRMFVLGMGFVGGFVAEKLKEADW